MKTKKAKVFLSNDKELLAVEYLQSDGYYAIVKRELSKGNTQVILTSSIMLELTETLLKKGSFEITGIDFMVENSDLEEEVSALLIELRKNKVFWSVLKEKLAFLQKEDSIEIKRISYKSLDDGEMLDVFVNGIFITSDKAFDSFFGILSACIERCLV